VRAVSKIWYDFEFIENGSTIDVISLGMVRESDDAEYYAVNSELAFDDQFAKRVKNHRWLMENVWPHLPLRGYKTKLASVGRDTRQVLDTPGVIDTSDASVRPVHLIAAEARDFILAAPNPQLRGWYCAYDHVLLMQLWGSMMNKPEGIPMWSYDLKQEADRLGNPDVPGQKGNEHNALADARHNRIIDLFLADYASRKPVFGDGALHSCEHQASNYTPCKVCGA
jgi:3' exoribonuclease, RNase T-like